MIAFEIILAVLGVAAIVYLGIALIKPEEF